jgi:hypothetical protein
VTPTQQSPLPPPARYRLDDINKPTERNEVLGVKLRRRHKLDLPEWVGEQFEDERWAPWPLLPVHMMRESESETVFAIGYELMSSRGLESSSKYDWP